MSIRDIFNFILNFDLNSLTYPIIALIIGYVLYIFLGIFFEAIRMSWPSIIKGFGIIIGILFFLLLFYLLIFTDYLYFF